jgi:hypothetical protein
MPHLHVKGELKLVLESHEAPFLALGVVAGPMVSPVMHVQTLQKRCKKKRTIRANP